MQENWTFNRPFRIRRRRFRALTLHRSTVNPDLPSKSRKVSLRFSKPISQPAFIHRLLCPSSTVGRAQRGGLRALSPGWRDMPHLSGEACFKAKKHIHSSRRRQVNPAVKQIGEAVTTLQVPFEYPSRRDQ